MKSWTWRRWFLVGSVVAVLAISGLALWESRRLQRRMEALDAQASRLLLGPAFGGWRWREEVPIARSKAAPWHRLLERLEFRFPATWGGERHRLAPVLDDEWNRLLRGGSLSLEEPEILAFLERHADDLEQSRRLVLDDPGPDWCEGLAAPPRAQHGDLQALLRLAAVHRLGEGDDAGARRNLLAAWRARQTYDQACTPPPESATRWQLQESLWLLRRLPRPDPDWIQRLEDARPWEHQLYRLRREVNTGLLALKFRGPVRGLRRSGQPRLRDAVWGDLLPSAVADELQLPLQRRCLLDELEPAIQTLGDLGEFAPCGFDLNVLDAGPWVVPQVGPGCIGPFYSGRLGELAEALSLQAHVDLTELALRMRRDCAGEREVDGLLYCWNRVRAKATCPDDWVLQAHADGRLEISHAHPDRLLPSGLETSLPLDVILPSP